MKTNNSFNFSYSAPSSNERKEIESIRNSYLNKNTSIDSKLQEIRKLDKKVKNTPRIIALIFGVVGILIFGLGLSMILEWKIVLWGVIISLVGIIPVIAAYPIYRYILSLMKIKYSAQILKLSEEILNNNGEKQ